MHERNSFLTLEFLFQLEVVGDIANTIWQIKEGMKKQDHWDYTFIHKASRFEPSLFLFCRMSFV